MYRQKQMALGKIIRVLMVTTEWPSDNIPSAVPFLVRDVDLLRKHNLIVDVLHFTGGKNPYNYLRATLQVMKKLRLVKYNVVHAQWGQSAIPVFFSSLPLITTFRGSDLFGITNKNGNYTLMGALLKLVSKVVAIRSDYVILVSNRMLPLVSKKRNVTVLPSGINLNLFSPGSKDEARKKLQIDPIKKVILFGGDINRPDKRYHLARKAKEILDLDLPVELLTAKVDHSEMPIFYRAADVLLMTSKHEGSPNMVKEALACNLPVVSVDVGDVKERINGLPGCFICESDNPEEIARALKSSLTYDNRDFNFRNTVLELNEDILIIKQVDIYKQVIDQS